MQIILTLVLLALIWMIYDLLNAPVADDDGNLFEEAAVIAQDHENMEKSTLLMEELSETSTNPVSTSIS